MSGPVHSHLGQFPPEKLDWERLIPLIGPANAALARYDGLLSAIPNAGVLLSPLTTQEAVLSSRIEGTQATMGEVLEVEAGGQRPGFFAFRELLNVAEGRMCFEAHVRVIRRFVDHEIRFVSHKYRCSQPVSLNSGVTTAAGRDVPMWCLLPAGLDKLGLEAGG